MVSLWLRGDLVCMCYDVQDGSTVIAVVTSAAFWVTTLGQVAAEWCLYLLVSVIPLYLYDISHLSLLRYLVSRPCFDVSTWIIDSWLKLHTVQYSGQL